MARLRPQATGTAAAPHYPKAVENFAWPAAESRAATSITDAVAITIEIITAKVLILTAILSIAAASSAQAGGAASSNVNWHSGQPQGHGGDVHTDSGNGGANGGDVSH